MYVYWLSSMHVLLQEALGRATGIVLTTVHTSQKATAAVKRRDVRILAPTVLEHRNQQPGQLRAISGYNEALHIFLA